MSLAGMTNMLHSPLDCASPGCNAKAVGRGNFCGDHLPVAQYAQRLGRAIGGAIVIPPKRPKEAQAEDLLRSKEILADRELLALDPEFAAELGITAESAAVYSCDHYRDATRCPICTLPSPHYETR